MPEARQAAGAAPGEAVAATLPPLVELPTGNVHVIPAQRRGSHDGRASAARAQPGPAPAPDLGAGGWVIYDGDGTPVEPALDSRASALRHMGVVAYHGASLPLTLHDPDGRPTGDRLP